MAWVTSRIRVHSSWGDHKPFFAFFCSFSVSEDLFLISWRAFLYSAETDRQSDSVTPAVIHVRNFTVKFVARFRWFLSFVNESMSKTFWWKHDQLFLPSVMSSLHFFLWMNISLHLSPGLFTSSVCLLA